MFRGVTPVEAERIDLDDTARREKRDREVEQDTPDCHIEPIERLAQR